MRLFPVQLERSLSLRTVILDLVLEFIAHVDDEFDLDRCIRDAVGSMKSDSLVTISFCDSSDNNMEGSTISKHRTTTVLRSMTLINFWAKIGFSCRDWGGLSVLGRIASARP